MPHPTASASFSILPRPEPVAGPAIPAGQNFDALLPADTGAPPPMPRPERRSESDSAARPPDDRAPPPPRHDTSGSEPERGARANEVGNREGSREDKADTKSDDAEGQAASAETDQGNAVATENAVPTVAAAPVPIIVAAPVPVIAAAIPQPVPAATAAEAAIAAVPTVDAPTGAAPAVEAATAQAASKQPASDAAVPGPLLSDGPNDQAADAGQSQQPAVHAAVADKDQHRGGHADLSQDSDGKKDQPDGSAASPHREAVSARDVAEVLAFKPAPPSVSAPAPDAGTINSAAIAPVGGVTNLAASAAAGPVIAVPTPQQDTDAVPLTGLSVEIAARAAEGKRRFDIRLDPPELGRIDVRLDVARDGHVTSRLVVERAETLDLLRRDAASLERALQQAGLRTDDAGLQFSLRDQSQGRWSGFEPASRPNLLIVPDENVAVQEAVRRGYGALRGLGRGIDISV